jgi:hypothetical protein
MPEFRVINGGGKGRGESGGGRDSFDAERAQQAFARMVVEILRALARGDGNAWPITKHFFEFCDLAAAAETPAGLLIDKAIGELHDEALAARWGGESRGDFEENFRGMLGPALKAAAEAMTSDGFAKARYSTARRALIEAAEHFLAERARRARERPSLSRREASAAVEALLAKHRGPGRDASKREPIATANEWDTPPPAPRPRPRPKPPSEPRRPQDIAYLAKLGTPPERLIEVIGDVNAKLDTVTLLSLSHTISRLTKKHVSITDVRDRLLPALRRAPPPDDLSGSDD